MQDLLQKHKGETCIIIGNGRSLENVPRSFLDKYPTFGGNYVLDVYTPTYYTAFDKEVIDNWHLLEPMLNGATAFIYEKHYYIQENAHPINWIEIRYPDDKSHGGNVSTVNLKLAYLMGFTTAYMVGHDWGTPRLHHRGMLPYITVEKNRQPIPPNVISRHTRDLQTALDAWHRDNRIIVNLNPLSSMPVIPKGDGVEASFAVRGLFVEDFTYR